MTGNWKTSAIGIVVLLVGAGLLFTGKITWEQFLLFLSVFGVGIAAKDHDAHGGPRKIT